MQLHVAMLTLDLFQSTYNRLPRPKLCFTCFILENFARLYCHFSYADDATEVVALAGVAIKRHNLQVCIAYMSLTYMNFFHCKVCRRLKLLILT